MIKQISAALTLLLTSAICSTPALANEIEKNQQGQTLFISSCATCHGVKGKGDGPVANNLIIKPTDLTTLTSKNTGEFPRQRVSKYIDGRSVISAHGSREMPVWGNIFKLQAIENGILQNDKDGLENSIKQQIDQLVTYIEQLQTP